MVLVIISGCGGRAEPAWFNEGDEQTPNKNDPWYVPAEPIAQTNSGNNSGTHSASHRANNDLIADGRQAAPSGLKSTPRASPVRTTAANDTNNSQEMWPKNQEIPDDYTLQLEKEIARLAAENQRLRQVPHGKGSGHLAAGPSFAVIGTGSGSLLERLAELEIELRRQENDLDDYRNQLTRAQNKQSETERELRITLGNLDSYRDERTKRMTAIQEMRRAETELAQATLDREAMNIRRLRIERQLYTPCMKSSMPIQMNTVRCKSYKTPPRK